MEASRIVDGAAAVGIAILTWSIGREVRGRVAERRRDPVAQPVPVLVLSAMVVGALVMAHPDHASELLSSVSKAVVAIVIVIGSRPGTRPDRRLVRRDRAVPHLPLASRARLIVSSMILGIGGCHRRSAVDVPDGGS